MSSVTDLLPSEFDRLARIVRAESAIVLEPGKEYLVETRLAPLLRRHAIPNYGALITRIESSAGAELRTAVIDAMTTNETSFFRDGHPWETLRRTLLPQLIEARRAARRLTVWCAAASSGQEPYSLALLLLEHFPEIATTWDIRIVATDLSPSTLERAAAGRFTQLEVNRGLPAVLLAKYFTRAGTEWQIGEAARRLIDFRLGNLIDAGDWLRIPTVDAVFMRNVLIYFDLPTRSSIVERVHARLRPDGFLLLGSAETTVGAAPFGRQQHDRTTVFVPGTPTAPRAVTVPAGASTA